MLFRSAKEILRHGFEELGMNTIWCGYYEGNQKSKRVQEKVGFAHAPHERGSNENMNRIIRRFFPKGTNFDEVPISEIRRAEEWMNNYPREVLGWQTAATLLRSYMSAC